MLKSASYRAMHPPSVHFQKVDIRDAEHIAGLARDIWKAHYTPIVGEDQVDYMLREIHGEDQIRADLQAGMQYQWILDDQDGRIGYFAYRMEQDTRRMLLSKIYLKETHRGTGIGFRVLEHLVHLAVRHDYQQIYLHVNRNNEIAIRAYRRWGFNPARALKRDIGQGFVMDDYEMTLPLPQKGSARTL